MPVPAARTQPDRSETACCSLLEYQLMASNTRYPSGNHQRVSGHRESGGLLWREERGDCTGPITGRSSGPERKRRRTPTRNPDVDVRRYWTVTVTLVASLLNVLLEKNLNSYVPGVDGATNCSVALVSADGGSAMVPLK